VNGSVDSFDTLGGRAEVLFDGISDVLWQRAEVGEVSGRLDRRAGDECFGVLHYA
jgi:hypothetical protein